MDVKELIFNLYKDEVLISIKFKTKIMQKYNLSPKEASDLFVKIQNYQINEYGTKLDYNTGLKTSDEARYHHKLANARKYSKSK